MYECFEQTENIFQAVFYMHTVYYIPITRKYAYEHILLKMKEKKM